MSGIDDARDRLAEELAGAVTFLYQLAYQGEVDLEQAPRENMTKAEARFGVEFGQADTRR